MTTLESPDYKSKISNIRNRLEQYVKLPKTTNSYNKFRFSSIINKFKPGSILFYVIPPIIITIIILIIKPKIFNKDIKDEKNDTITKFRYKNAILSGLVVGICISIAVFLYIRKK